MANPNQRIVIEKSNPYSLWQATDSCLDNIVNSSTHWHRFTIVDGIQFQKEEVLKLIIEKVYPAHLIPVKYQTEGKDTFFIARNCGPAIRSLCSLRLTLKFPDSSRLVVLKLVLCYKLLSEEPIVMKSFITSANMNRYSHQEKILDLTLYHKDPELKDIFTILCMPKTMSYVLNLSRQYFNRLTLLVLASNDLTSLQHLQMLGMSKTLKGLDLRDNKLSWEGLSKIPPTLKLSDIWLDGNPLCDTYSSCLSYIRHVKIIIPTLDTIDDRKVSGQIDACEFLTRNFLVNPSITCPFVDQFLNQYFKLYEDEERWRLGKMYHARAVFSISASHLQGQSTSSSTKLISYAVYSRNVLTMSDYAKMYDQLKCGPEEIIDVLCKLPKVQFDPHSFTVDVPIFKENQLACINVSGVFRELTNNPSIYSFHRTFVLQPCRTNKGEWKIVNDMYIITNATTEQVNRCFLRGDFSLSRILLNKIAPNEDDIEKMVDTFSNVTTMNKIWTEKFLEESSWDMEVALRSFTDKYRIDAVPREAFIMPESA